MRKCRIITFRENKGVTIIDTHPLNNNNIENIVILQNYSNILLVEDFYQFPYSVLLT